MTVEDIYLLMIPGDKVVLHTDKFSFYGDCSYIPSDYMSYAVVKLYDQDGILVIDCGTIGD